MSALSPFSLSSSTLLIATRFEALALRFNLRRLVLFLSLPAMVLYLFLTGAAPATARSVIMLVAFVLALYAEREGLTRSMLCCLRPWCSWAINPPSLFDISFQLSFLALWGIVIAVPSWSWSVSMPSRTAGCARCSSSLPPLAPPPSLLPVPVLFYFNQASLNGILSNFLIVPLLGYGAVLAGFCALPFVFVFPPLAHALLWLAGKLVVLSNWLIMLFAQLPLLRFHAITQLDMLIFLLFMSAVTFISGRRLKIVFCVLLPSVAVCVHLAAFSPWDGRLHVTMLSVGQGESLLIRFPDGGTMLVD